MANEATARRSEMVPTHRANPNAFAVRASDGALTAAAKLAQAVEHAERRAKAVAILDRGIDAWSAEVTLRIAGDSAMAEMVRFESECRDARHIGEDYERDDDGYESAGDDAGDDL